LLSGIFVKRAVPIDRRGILRIGTTDGEAVPFTEHGAIMAESVLNSLRAVEMSVFVVRAFVKFREMLASNKTFG
jgi:exo-beta-1,3-glucanase (GH17 family)